MRGGSAGSLVSECCTGAVPGPSALGFLRWPLDNYPLPPIPHTQKIQGWGLSRGVQPIERPTTPSWTTSPGPPLVRPPPPGLSLLGERPLPKPGRGDPHSTQQDRGRGGGAGRSLVLGPSKSGRSEGLWSLHSAHHCSLPQRQGLKRILEAPDGEVTPTCPKQGCVVSHGGEDPSQPLHQPAATQPRKGG